MLNHKRFDKFLFIHSKVKLNIRLSEQDPLTHDIELQVGWQNKQPLLFGSGIWVSHVKISIQVLFLISDNGQSRCNKMCLYFNLI